MAPGTPTEEDPRIRTDLLGEGDALVPGSGHPLAELTFDVPGGELIFGTNGASASWLEVPTRDFMGIPVLDVIVAGESHAIFFDTGAPISYLQNVEHSALPSEGTYEDFYPGFGTFETETWRVGGAGFKLRVGQLPDLLGLSLMMGGASGIVGLGLIRDRKAAYSAGGGWLRLAHPTMGTPDSVG